MLNSGVACYFHSVQPYVVTETPVLREGEYFEASIALVDFPSALDYTNTMIVVNNDTLDVDSLGFSKYRVKGDKLGVNKLYIEGMVRNRITGGETHGSGEYYFYVDKE